MIQSHFLNISPPPGSTAGPIESSPAPVTIPLPTGRSARKKHIVKAFPRRYDDQAGRLVNMHEGRENGAIQAARLIAENFFNLF